MCGAGALSEPGRKSRARSMEESVMREDKEADVDRYRSDWDAFAGPVRLMADDRVPVQILPMLAAAYGLRIAAEMNYRVMEQFARGPFGR